MSPTLSPEDFGKAAEVAIAAASRESQTEVALTHLTRFAHAALGDHAAAKRPGALLPGERDYRVSGVFVVTPDRRYNMLVANHGFPPEQRRLAIPIEWNHPGEVVRISKPIHLANTDEHGTFRQFLNTSRMGSSIYFPILSPSGLVAQIVAAAQSRWTYCEEDLARLGHLAAAAGAVWRRTDGDAWVAADYPADDIWRAEDNA